MSLADNLLTWAEMTETSIRENQHRNQNGFPKMMLSL